MTEPNNNVLVTGFGPFGEHQVNASWEAVSALPGKIEGYNIIKHQIPVSYQYVEENVPLLWKRYTPKLVIHVGVSSFTKKIQLETQANRTGYQRKDVEMKCPENACCKLNTTDDCLKTELRADAICEKLNTDPLLQAVLSNDPGRYLCEFIYYVSLTQDRKRTLFVHVPPLNQPFSKSQLTYCLEEILRAALELIEEEDRKCVCYPTDATKIYRNGRAAAF